MKSQNAPAAREAWPLRSFAIITTFLLSCPSLPAAGEPSVSGVPSPSKPYTLYLGANLTVEWQGKLWPVRGVMHNSFVIEAEGKRVPVRDTDLRMKINPTLKLTAARATITEVKAERAYTRANDPRHYAHGAMLAAGEASDASDLAAGRLNNMANVDGAEQNVIAHWNPDWGPTPSPTFSAGDLANASDRLQRSLSVQGSDISSVPDAVSKEQTELARKLFDAFSLSFKISTAKPLVKPYLVVMVRFRDQSGDPKGTRLLVYAQVLPTVDDRPQTVRLLRGGFPRGYQLVNYQIHLYDHGTEVATSAAPNQMAMTSDEAFKYSTLDYAVRNRHKTLPPTPAGSFWPADISARLPAKDLGRTYYVKVDKNGRAVGYFDDQAGVRPVRDAELDAVRPELRFNPALNKGKPVEGIVAVNLGRGPD